MIRYIAKKVVATPDWPQIPPVVLGFVDGRTNDDATAVARKRWPDAADAVFVVPMSEVSKADVKEAFAAVRYDELGPAFGKWRVHACRCDYPVHAHPRDTAPYCPGCGRTLLKSSSVLVDASVEAREDLVEYYDDLGGLD